VGVAIKLAVALMFTFCPTMDGLGETFNVIAQESLHVKITAVQRRIIIVLFIMTSLK
jgi:predicted small secreted protein